MFGRDEKVSALRLTAAQYIILGIFLVLAYGLWRLQVMQSEYYSLAAEKNRIRNVPILAPRGKIVAHRRLYPRNGFMAHLIGYVGDVTEDMLNHPQFELYNPGDVVGISGAERQYNNMLMGQNGSRRALVNSHGREVGQLDTKDAVAGKQLKLTVDIDLQIAAEQALEGKNGAIVAMDPRTGEILAMAVRS